MGKPTHPNGFTLIEMMLVFLMMSGLTLIMLPIGLDSSRSEKSMIVSSLIQTQFAALKLHQHRTVDHLDIHSDYPIVFTGKGMTNQAQTIQLDENGILVIMLGPGRIHE